MKASRQFRFGNPLEGNLRVSKELGVRFDLSWLQIEED